jgi:hypothetical protein
MQLQGPYIIMTLPTAHRAVTSGMTLRLGLLRINLPPWFSYHAETDTMEGFNTELWGMVARELGAVSETVFSAFGPLCNDIGPMCVECMVVGGCDVHFANILLSDNLGEVPSFEFTSSAGTTHNASMDDFVYTSPSLTTFKGGVIYQSTRSRDLWTFMDPFATDLWLAIGGWVLVTTALLASLGALAGGEKGSWRSGTVIQHLPHTLYHVTAALLGGEEVEYSSPSLRLMRLGLLLVVLILQATYTANLAAFFNRPLVEMRGPRDMTELRDSVACIAWDSYAPK